MQEITITIDLAGAVEVSVKGIKGKSCKDATSEIERKLGKTTSDTATTEMFQHDNVKTSNRA